MANFSATISGQQNLIDRINRINSTIEQSISRTMLKVAIMVQREVKIKLSGDVLKVQTGTLRSSINATVEQGRGKITGKVGTNVVYAAIHEYGFNGMITRKGKSYHANFPERSFLRSTLKEMKSKIIDEIKKDTIKNIQDAMHQ